MLQLDEIERLVRLALTEDVGRGDVTSLATVPADTIARARMMAREPLVVAGLPVASAAFRQLDPGAHIQKVVAEGVKVAAGACLLEVRGSARALLTAERVALNFVQRMSGIATLTADFVGRVAGTRAVILDTRKTTPGLRAVEKYAVRCGGGQNHRFGLFDMVLIKDNHLAALASAKPNPINAAVQRARKEFPGMKIEVEADQLEQVKQAVDAGADQILLDNMSLTQMADAVRLVAGRAKTEASGGVRLDSVRAIAETGVDFISVGALTHSARAMDIGLDFDSAVELAKAGAES